MDTPTALDADHALLAFAEGSPAGELASRTVDELLRLLAEPPQLTARLNLRCPDHAG
jgi:hypothetical protein